MYTTIDASKNEDILDLYSIYTIMSAMIYSIYTRCVLDIYYMDVRIYSIYTRHFLDHGRTDILDLYPISTPKHGIFRVFIEYIYTCMREYISSINRGVTSSIYYQLRFTMKRPDSRLRPLTLARPRREMRHWRLAAFDAQTEVTYPRLHTLIPDRAWVLFDLQKSTWTF